MSIIIHQLKDFFNKEKCIYNWQENIWIIDSQREENIPAKPRFRPVQDYAVLASLLAILRKKSY